jgi:hypothetical protein
LVPFAKAVVDGRFRGAARHGILGAGSFKSASVVASASSSSSRAAALFIDWALSKQGLSTPMKNYSAALSNVGGGCSEKSDLSISAQLWPDWL